MFSVQALRSVSRERGRLYEPVLTEDYELSLALRVERLPDDGAARLQGGDGPDADLKMLWAQRLRWYRGAFEALRMHGFRRGHPLRHRLAGVLAVGRGLALAVPRRRWP